MAATPSTPAVDIVIPVYNAPDDLRRCVDSVLACTHGDYRLVLIDDASPDPAIAAFFAALAHRALSQLVLLRNDTNRGFTGTANRGMMHGAGEGRDVVLLNSDTVVTQGWLDALRRCAASSPHIGTITPFSNNAEICSFPRFCADNRWPEGTDPEGVRAALERAAVPTYPELPTGVGFCLFVRRDLIRGIGLFDEQAFGRGYGEENDFCLRAFRAGWRNVLCDDAFVLHLGARSFSADKAALVEKNARVLNDRFPHYDAMVADYVARDPLRPIRDAALAQLRAAGDQEPGLLHLIHGHGGGTEHHVRALIDASRRRYRHYLAIAAGPRWQVEEHLGDGGVRSFAFTRAPAETVRELLGALAATFRIGLVHLHNVSGCREGLEDALRALRLPYGCTVHDLDFACPTITLIGRDGFFCGGETDVAVCRGCLAAQPGFEGVDIARWRDAHRELVAGARFVIAPSRWAAGVWRRYFPAAAVDVIAHGAPGVWANRTLPDNADRRESGPRVAVLLPEDDVPTVAVLGAIGPDKGARRIERMVALARGAGMRLRFVVVGYLDVHPVAWQSDDALLTVHGRYRPDDLPRLLDHYRARLVVFPSAGPETFSFTLSEAWAAGRPVVVPPVGALAERVAEAGAGWILDDADWRDEARMLARIAVLVADRGALAAAAERARAVRQPTLADMAERTLAHYAAVVPVPPADDLRLPAERLRDAAGYRLWWPPEAHDDANVGPGASALPAPAAPSGGVAQVAYRLHRTRPGRALARLLPEPLVAALRARLR
ncbi:MAG: glycosyltransferase [Betaproteobacteria bacterium]|nr:glycosyltransferase [Betaproteobacteria bacterium]MBK6601541.1 glycosyltransferase [Betaproteobacteria bacterium]MBK7079792.1 glycosyltransferase [Betaproteobacteria bacterium]MBK8688419.1 glycosyltransferase [Betaproteobacteria bacterium]